MRPTWISLALLLLAGCRTWPQPTVDARQFQPAKSPLRVVLFPPVCTEADGGCADLDVGGVAGRLKMELEMAGYTIVDGETLVAEARSRENAAAELRLFGQQVASAATLAQRGSLFEDLPPEVRRRIVEEARADGILRLRLAVSAKDGSYPLYGVRSLDLQARLGLGPDEAAAWAVRCSEIWVTGIQFIGGPGRTYAQGAEEAARCVSRKATAP